MTPPSQSDPDILRHNNPGLTVDLGVGLWGIPLPVDYDGDGVKDLLVSCPTAPTRDSISLKTSVRRAIPVSPPPSASARRG